MHGRIELLINWPSISPPFTQNACMCRHVRVLACALARLFTCQYERPVPPSNSFDVHAKTGCTPSNPFQVFSLASRLSFRPYARA